MVKLTKDELRDEITRRYPGTLIEKYGRGLIVTCENQHVAAIDGFIRSSGLEVTGITESSLASCSRIYVFGFSRHKRVTV